LIDTQSIDWNKNNFFLYNYVFSEKSFSDFRKKDLFLKKLQFHFFKKM